MPMKMSLQQYKRSMPLFVMLTLFSAIGLIAWLGIMPFQRFITEKADSIQEYHATRENRERQINKLPELEKQFENILAHEQTLNVLLSEDQIVDFVKTLEGLALSTGVHVEIQAKDKDAIEEKQAARPAKKGAEVDEDTATSKKKEQPKILDSVPYSRYLHVSIVVTGEYENIMAFLHKMETLPLGLDVVGLSVKTRDIEEQDKGKADNPGGNPFLILSQGTVESAPPEDAKVVIPGSLEATFDTVVYVSK